MPARPDNLLQDLVSALFLPVPKDQSLGLAPKFSREVPNPRILLITRPACYIHMLPEPLPCSDLLQEPSCLLASGMHAMHATHRASSTARLQLPSCSSLPCLLGNNWLKPGPFFLLPLTETVMPWEWQLKTELEQALCVKYPHYIPLR